jgi:hypothetical protein
MKIGGQGNWALPEWDAQGRPLSVHRGPRRLSELCPGCAGDLHG